MEFLRKRFLCDNLLVLRIPLILATFVILIKLFMDLSRLLMLGMLGLFLLVLDLLPLWLIHHYSYSIVRMSQFTSLFMSMTSLWRVCLLWATLFISLVLCLRLKILHWWKKALWSRFVRAIGPACRTGINYSGPMPVPVPARTGTDRSPCGRAAARGGLGHWSRFVARTGIVDLCRVLCFFSI
jgi:hypothetical protein